MNEAQRFVVCTGGGDRFDVIVGHRLNDKPLSLADANRLARRASASTISVVGHLIGAVPKFKPLLDDYDRRRRREMS
jgi:phosphopantothenate synthetase